MKAIQSNVFPILNLGDLEASYQLLPIRGLEKDQPEYFLNCQALIRKLSYALSSPVTIIEDGDQPCLVLRSGTAVPPSPFRLIRASVYFDPPSEVRKLDFRSRQAADLTIGSRFLQFMLQEPIGQSAALWQPGSGKPFFEKSSGEHFGPFVRYSGFSVRVVETIDAGLAVRVDVTRKVTSADPLPMRMNRDQFRGWKGHTCVYHFGHKWYEIQLHAYSQLSVTEERFTENGKDWQLLENIVERSRKPIPPELAALTHDASVVKYQSNRGESRSAPAALCYPVFDTTHPEVKRRHGDTLLRPDERLNQILEYARRYLRGLQFGSVNLRLADEPLRLPQKMFRMPDWEFGKERVLSVRGTDHALQITPGDVGRTRLNLLTDADAGFYSSEPLDRHYLMLPQSVMDSFGQQYVADLKASVAELFSNGATRSAYEPVLVAYPDRGPRVFPILGKAIIEAAKEHCTKPGYALVMLHHLDDKAVREHDQLAAYVVRELRKLNISGAVQHSKIGHESYEQILNSDGVPRYQIRQDRSIRFRGYLRNVALNKVLLNNERWPFVLATPTQADLTVGIDVKGHTAGFTVVGRRGHTIRTRFSTSRQKEQLLEEQVRKYLSEIVAAEAADVSTPIRQICIHRDGRCWPSELRGIRRCIEDLTKDGALAPDVGYGVLEIAKSAAAPVRLFDVSDWNGNVTVRNPEVGRYWIANETDGYLCATGHPFRRNGTVRPLHVKYVEGTIPFEFCLEDVYYLTTLTWTRPEDCTRYPITIKLTDRRLGDEASDYDQDAVEFAEAELVEENQ